VFSDFSRQKLAENGGVALVQIFPGTSAADAKFQAGDVLLAIDGTRLTGIPMFLDRMSTARAGDVLGVDVVRDGVRLETLRAWLNENTAISSR
jgi:S1-C subfamily serine protease